MLIQSNLLQILSMVLAVWILGLQRKTKTANADALYYYLMRFEDFDILINKGFLNDTREFDQYIAYGTPDNMQQIHIRGEDRTRL